MDNNLQEKLSEILKLSDELNQEMEQQNVNMIFNYEDLISSLVLIIEEKDTGEVIRKIPADEAIMLMKKMRDIINNLVEI